MSYDMLRGHTLTLRPSRCPNPFCLWRAPRGELDLQFHLVLRLEKPQEGRWIESEIRHQDARSGVAGHRPSAERDPAGEGDRLGDAVDLEVSGNPHGNRAAIH